MTNGDMMPCPVCGETIQRSAKKCKHCREWLDPAMRARASGGASQARQIQIRGQDVLFPPGAQAPDSPCLICGGEENIRLWEKTFSYTPPWAYITLLLGLLPGAIICSILTKRSARTLPRCGKCRGSMILFNLIGWLVGLGGLFVFPFLGAFVGGAIDKRDGSGTGIVLGFLVWFLAIIVIVVWSSFFARPSCKLIDDDGVLLRFPKPDVTRRILTGI